MHGIIPRALVVFGSLGTTAAIFDLRLGLAVFIISFGGFILQGLRRIEADPPQKAQVTRWGKRLTETVSVKSKHTGEYEPREQSVYKDEGWRFFPLFPYWYGLILVEVQRITFDVTSNKTRTPDGSNSRVPVAIAGRPSPEHLIQFIDSGKKEGVITQLTGKVLERMREWAMSNEEGPVNWRELNMSQLEAVSILIKDIAGNSLTRVPVYAQEVPTWIWLRYYLKPQPKEFLEREKSWAKDDWKRVKTALKKIKNKHSPEAIIELQEAVERRRQEVRNLRTGTGEILVKDLGFIIERLNIGDVDVLDGVGEKAEAKAREIEEREAEKLELAHVQERIKELMESPFNYSKEQAQEIVQTERGKVPKAIEEHKLNIAPETRDAVERIFTSAATTLVNAWAKKKESD